MDVTQDTFLKLYEQMNKSEYFIENPKAWLYKVAGNLSLNLLNKTNRQKEVNEQMDFVSMENSDPESQFISHENKLMIPSLAASLSTTWLCNEESVTREKLLDYANQHLQ